ncbi:MAG: hypothetical protein AB3N20_21325 [Rhizobiaceae bacterium]
MVYLKALTCLLFAFVVAAASTGPASAAGGRVTINSGEEVLLHGYMGYRPIDCKSFNMDVKVVKHPKHGKLRQVVTMVDPAKGYGGGFHSNRCHGTKVSTKLFYYRAPKGFKGTVQIVLRPVGFQGGRKQRFYVTVK